MSRFSNEPGNFSKFSDDDSLDGANMQSGKLSHSSSTQTVSTTTNVSPNHSSLSLAASNLYDQNHNPISSDHSIIYHEIPCEKRNASLYQVQSPTLDGFTKKALPDDKQSSSRLTFRVVLAAVVSFLTNSLPSGFNMGVVNTPEEIFKEFFNSTMNGNPTARLVTDSQQIEFLWSIAVSLLLVGAFIGCTFTGYLADTIGRRGLLILNSLVGLLGVSLCWLSKFLPSVPVFMAGRFIAGLHTGVGSSLVPMYLIEIAPKNFATALGTIHVIGLNGGQMVSMILGLEPILGSYTRWQLLFFVNSVFIIIGLAVILLCPESPIYLYVMKKNASKAIDALEKIRGQTQLDLVDEIQAMKQEAKNRESNSMSFLKLLRQSKAFRSSLLIVCALHAGQQLVGINAVFYYSTKTFRGVGLSAQTAQYSSIGCTTLNTACAFLVIFLRRRFSPRNLLLSSTLATGVCLVSLTLSMTFKTHFEWLNFVTIAIILAYVFFFAIGQGPIPFMIGGELFDQSSMAIGMSIGCFVNWFCNFLIAITFPMIVLLINQYVFLIFFAFNVLIMVFVYFKISNTRQANDKESSAVTCTN